VVAEQRRRTLRVVIWIAMPAALAISLGNFITVGPTPVALLLLALTACCLAALWLNRRGRVGSAGVLVFLAILTTAHFAVSTGSGINDTGMLAYPILVILSGLIFGGRLLMPAALAAGTSLVIVTWDDWHAVLRDPGSYRLVELVAVFALTGGAALIARLALRINEEAVQRLRRSENRVWLAYERTLEGWARALEYRDRDTEGHTRRVTDLSVRFAEVLGLRGEDLRRVRWGALLHDIGKLAVPDAVLLKGGPLDATERATMNRHSEYAREMLAGIPFLADCMDIPCHHHERWDGEGYPDRLAGYGIPFAARLFAIVDQWEALGSDRPYRAAWSRQAVVDYLGDNAGSIFDPELVEVFLSRIGEIDPGGEPEAAGMRVAAS
jgi:putative nucleotidyltransferase with HDIG domain